MVSLIDFVPLFHAQHAEIMSNYVNFYIFSKPDNNIPMAGKNCSDASVEYRKYIVYS